MGVLTLTENMKANVVASFDHMARTYDRVLGLHGRFGERLVALAGVAAGDVVLDVACGRGASLFPAASAVGESGRVEGIDLSAEMVRLALAGIDERRLANATAQVMDAESLQFDDGTFDVVLCGFALFFFPDRERAFAEFARVLKPGGIAAMSSFADGAYGYPWFDELLSSVLPEAHLATQLLRVDPDLLHAQLQRNGFDEAASVVAAETQHFESADAHWDWLMDHGPQFMIRRLDAEQRAAFRTAVAARIEDHRDASGLRFDKPARFTTARRARVNSVN
jgi:O-methyltransferase / aklanonic acid methyltransferase